MITNATIDDELATAPVANAALESLFAQASYKCVDTSYSGVRDNADTAVAFEVVEYAAEPDGTPTARQRYRGPSEALARAAWQTVAHGAFSGVTKHTVWRYMEPVR
jgi:hypothetical protein